MVDQSKAALNGYFVPQLPVLFTRLAVTKDEFNSLSAQEPFFQAELTGGLIRQG